MFFGAYHGYMTAKAYNADTKSFDYNWQKGAARTGILIGLAIPPLLGWLFGEDNNMYLVYFVYGAIPYYGLGYMMYGLAPIIFHYLGIEGALPTEYRDEFVTKVNNHNLPGKLFVVNTIDDENQSQQVQLLIL